MAHSSFPHQRFRLAILMASMVAVTSVWSQEDDPAPVTESEAPFASAAEGEADLEAGKARYQQVCAQCHGERGEGNFQLKAPSIANLPDWYVAGQIGKFQKDWRGSRPEDVPGNLMHAIAMSLDPVAIRDVAGYIRSMTLVPTVVTLKGGNPERGAELFRERCMECHRYNGRGEPAFRSAQLIGLQDWYIVSQLKKFRDGIRGAHENDAEGTKMHRISERMTDGSFHDVASHIAELAEKYAVERPRRR